MNISQKGVEHIARLARIELTAAEQQRIELELERILEFVEKLKEVETQGIPPLTGGTELQHVTREDAPLDEPMGESGAGLISAAPRARGGYVEVPAVFDRE